MAKKSHLVTRRRAPVGTPPGTLIADERASPTTIRMIVIDDKGAVETDSATLADVEKAKAGRKRLWVDVTGLADIALIQLRWRRPRPTPRSAASWSRSA